MYSTKDENGIINNFATEPKVYYATYPSAQQQRNYVIQAVLAVGLLTLLTFIAVTVS